MVRRGEGEPDQYGRDKWRRRMEIGGTEKNGEDDDQMHEAAAFMGSRTRSEKLRFLTFAV